MTDGTPQPAEPDTPADEWELADWLAHLDNAHRRAPIGPARHEREEDPE
jgi:hypothetical protein